MTLPLARLAALAMVEAVKTAIVMKHITAWDTDVPDVITLGGWRIVGLEPAVGEYIR